MQIFCWYFKKRGTKKRIWWKIYGLWIFNKFLFTLYIFPGSFLFLFVFFLIFLKKWSLSNWRSVGEKKGIRGLQIMLQSFNNAFAGVTMKFCWGKIMMVLNWWEKLDLWFCGEENWRGRGTDLYELLKNEGAFVKKFAINRIFWNICENVSISQDFFHKCLQISFIQQHWRAYKRSFYLSAATWFNEVY